MTQPDETHALIIRMIERLEDKVDHVMLEVANMKGRNKILSAGVGGAFGVISAAIVAFFSK